MPDGTGQSGAVLGREIPCRRSWVNTGAEESLVHVDIPQPGDEVLVEQDGLDLARTPSERTMQPLRGEC
jgi:hypothetical protein